MIRAGKSGFFGVPRPDYEKRPLWLRYLIAFALAFAMAQP